MELLQEIKQIYTKLQEKQSLKNLSFFLLINIIFMFVEIVYGLVSNSLGLLTDGAHMLLDCTAIVIGMYSEYLSDKPLDSSYNFGYLRSEVLGTFINSVFLVFIALYIVFESLERFINPKEIHSDHLILISFLGLLVNMIGIYFLHGEHGHSHGTSNEKLDHSNHSHEIKTNTDIESASQELKHNSCHSDHNHGNSHDYNENIYAIYIHILADALGSVSVLISSFLIRYYGLNFTDPLCSLFITIMILYSAWPVLKSSSSVLLHILPNDLESKKSKIENSVKMLIFY